MLLSAILISVRTLLLIFSLYGGFKAVQSRFNLPMEFALSLVFSVIGVLMFVAGILNMMREAAILLTFCGFLCGVYSIRCGKARLSFTFSMPEYDASILSSYDRYYLTQMMVVFGLALVRFQFLFGRRESTKPPSKVIGIALFAVIAMGIAFLNIIKSEIKQVFDETVRNRLEAAVSDHALSSDAAYLLVTDSPDFGYARYVFRYLLNPVNVGEIDVPALKEIQTVPEGYDYLVFLTEDTSVCDTLGLQADGASPAVISLRETP